jgi:serine/threonine protein kinase
VCCVLGRGYIAPEYALNGQVSTKSDVFSFGVLMLEVISGRRIFTVSSPENQQYLLHWVNMLTIFKSFNLDNLSWL